jgi:predicted alpha-1,2-mannosidase
MSLLEFVHPLQGSDSRHPFSTGNVYPAVGTPRGLTYWTPQSGETGFLFDRQAVKLNGFRGTHCPSPWMDDYGHFDVLPVVGRIDRTPAGRGSGYVADHASASPHLYRARLLRYRVDVEMTATRSCGVFRFRYPEDAGDSASIVLQSGLGRVHTFGTARVETAGGRTRVLLTSSSNAGGVAAGFACYVVAETDAPVRGASTFTPQSPLSESRECSGPRAGVALHVRPGGPVTLRVATSFVSHAQAIANLEQEVGGKSFDEVASGTAALWERWLAKVQMTGGDDRDRRTLYSCLYRVGLWPMAMHEFDRAGNPIHYSPHTDRVERGVFYTNNGFWDTYRTVYALLALIDRDGFAEIVEGFLQHYRQSGWLPRWCSPGHHNAMIGSHGDVVLAEAIGAGIGGFSREEAYEAIRKDAFVPPDRPGVGRPSLEAYHRYGYVPADVAHDSVCWTLDNAHCDWCIAQVATTLGRSDDARLLMQRSQNYRHLWHPQSRLMRPRRADGSWLEPWNEFEWADAYVEGGPWQHSLHVPHDPRGLADLHGGVDALVARLDEMLSLPARFEVGRYAEEIHEQTEMALARDGEGNSFGQYAQSNQPVHAFLWLPAQLGRGDWTAKQVRRVMRSLYSPDDFPGDEDNGEMSAWYVLGALGVFANPAGSGKTIEAPGLAIARVAT